MNIGFVGLGKLGLPVALAMESRGHRVIGCDPSPNVMYSVGTRHMLYEEEGADELIKTTNLQVVGMEQVVAQSDLVFLAVQTPHESIYEGIAPLPSSRADFDYEALRAAVRQVNEVANILDSRTYLVIISTVLPGTIRSQVLPLCSDKVRLCYNPFFIAMGTTIQDFLNPEFVLLGGSHCGFLAEFYKTLHDRPHFVTSIESAELIKVAYNTFIGMKIVFANTLMEICHKTEADVDAVSAGLRLATERLISGRYLSGGMGDGGHCHIRDGVALSWLARKLNLSHDIFSDLLEARQGQTDYLAGLVYEEAKKTGLPVVLLGKAFKPKTNIVAGSAALLLANRLRYRGLGFASHDPYVDLSSFQPDCPAVYCLATAHPEYAALQFPAGSVVLDPFGMLPDQTGVRVIRVGRK